MRLIVGERAPWGGFPKVIRNGELGALTKEPDYQAAKGGDAAAALALAQRLVTPETVERIRSLIGDRRPSLLPVLAAEESGRNKIPLAMACVIAERLGLDVEMGVVQRERVKRTGAGSDHRLAFTPTFDGAIAPGKEYLLLDDTLTMGGTIASLRGYVVNRGGDVLGAAVMTAHEGALDLPVKPGMLAAIASKHGQAMNDYWKETFGYGIEYLTQGEAGHLKAAPTVDALRNRIAAARNAAIGQLDAVGVEAAEGSGRQKDGGLTEDPLERANELQGEQRSLIENAPGAQAVQAVFDSYIQDKQEQAEGLEERLETLIDQQRAKVQRAQSSAPGVLSLPATKRAHQAQLAQQQSRLQTLESRLELVREVRDGMGLHSPKLEELATRKFRAERPELAAELDATREAARKELAQGRQAKRDEQAQGRGQALGLSVSRRQQ